MRWRRRPSGPDGHRVNGAAYPPTSRALSTPEDDNPGQTQPALDMILFGELRDYPDFPAT